jgi:general secretion pathway protein G
MTLVEIIIVLAIIGAIATFITVNVVGSMNNARIQEANAEVNRLVQIVEQFRVTHGDIPEQLEDLARNVNGFQPLLSRVPEDPWGQDYHYESNNDGTYTVYSSGPDEQSGTDDDIYPEGQGPDA